MNNTGSACQATKVARAYASDTDTVLLHDPVLLEGLGPCRGAPCVALEEVDVERQFLLSGFRV